MPVLSAQPWLSSLRSWPPPADRRRLPDLPELPDPWRLVVDRRLSESCDSVLDVPETLPSSPSSAEPGPVTADDVDAAVWAAVDALGGVPDEAWSAKAGGLEWDCREAADHLADDLFAYAAQLGPRRPPLDTHVPFAFERRPDGPALSIRAEPASGTAGIMQVLEASGAFLSALVRTKGPEIRAHHVMVAADPEGFAAMGVVETLAHAHDVAQGLGVAFEPPAGVCERVLFRLFRDVPTGSEPWPTFLWATGRGELPGHERLTRWRWHGAPRAEW
jgi:hypothetical protein